MIVAAAGSGSRMKTKTNKQFLLVRLIPILARTLKGFSDCKFIDNIIISARKEDIENIESLIAEFNINKVTEIIEGGTTRQESVFNALKIIDDNSTVLIHDGARPFFSDELIKSLIETAEETGAAAPGIIPKDSVAIVDENGFFKKATVRSELRQLQTPQVFNAKLIKKAHLKAFEDKKEFTDDCSLFSYYGGNIRIIDGEQSNIKITVPADIPLAELISKNK